MSSGYLALTEGDRAEMLAAIGVSAIDDLFAQIPEAVRFARDLAVPGALTEVELVRHLEQLAARNVDTSTELSFLGCGIYDHYVPAIVDTFLGRGELLTAYTPYQPEMSQGVLQAIFEYQTAICELTGLDVSNASGYDGTTVAADACFIAKAHTGRTRIVLAETLHPMARQVVKTYAPGFGMDVVEVPHDGGTIDPERFRVAADGAAVAMFQHPNVFGCLEDAPALAEAATAGGGLPVAHVDLASLGILEAPGAYGCAMAIGEGQSIGNYQSYGGPHYGFLSARRDLIRRMPGRIVGETSDLNGDRGFVLTLQTREQHIRREKATSNITTNQTLLALGGLITLCWLGPDGLRELGETCSALTAYAVETVPLERAFDRPVFKEVAFRTPIPARELVARAREHGVHPGYAIGAEYPGMDDVLLSAFTEKRTQADVDRLAEIVAAVTAA
ncbi:MAG: aminomethyl-transferring glycine dehydrogenase subunit GcvPA [Gaiellales bacterium]